MQSESSFKHQVQRCIDGIEETEFQLNQLPKEHGCATVRENFKGKIFDFKRQHQEATLESEELKSIVPASTDSIPLEGKGCHQPTVPEEVDTSPPKFTHWPIIDIDNLPKTSPSDACHPSPGLPGFWCDITSPLPPASPSDEGPPYSSNTSTPHASVQINSPVIEALTLTMHVNPCRAHNVSHALNSSLPMTNNNKKSMNLKHPPACQETVPPTSAGQLSLLQALSATTTGMNKKG